MIIVDGHNDLAWNALTFGRDYTRSAAQTRQREAGGIAPRVNGDTLLGWDDWIAGQVGIIFATLFATPRRFQEGDWDHQCYRDAEEARRLYQQQLDYYHRLVDEHPQRFRLLHNQADLERVLQSWQDDHPRQIGLLLLMEGADALRHPDELVYWFEQGVRIVGPAWAATRYSGGTGEPGPLTRDGFALLEVMSDLGLVLDISHLSEQAAEQSLEVFGGTVIASHANPRALVPDSQKPDRHLADQTMRGLFDRQGVMGVVLANHFLVNRRRKNEPRVGVTLEEVANHIDYICQLAGSADHAAIGSDIDGGFGLQNVPLGIDTIADLRKIGLVLADRGYGSPDVAAILGGNWLRVLKAALAEV